MIRSPIAMLVPLALGAASAGACWFTAGVSLDLFLGSVLLAALLAPPLSLTSVRPFDGAATAVAITLGIAAVWLCAVATRGITFTSWMSCALVLLSFATALAAAARLLARFRIHPVASAAIVTTVALAWLTWPVWVSPWLPGHSVSWSVSLHPLFAINAACQDLGIWTEQRIAYRLTNLGQDVPYRLPTSVVPCVMLHAALTAVFSFGARLTRTRPPVWSLQ